VKAKIQQLGAIIESHLSSRKYNVLLDLNITEPLVQIQFGRKYAKISVAGSIRYVIDCASEMIHGTKSNGSIDKNVKYTTLNNISGYHWGGFHPYTLNRIEK